jgi:hypothetical protein
MDHEAARRRQDSPEIIGEVAGAGRGVGRLAEG